MLYKKNSDPHLDMELFRNPTAEYRGAPFWAWNCKLDEEELLWQLDVLKTMGFGGAHIHVRTGMDTKYLSDQFMDLVRACVGKAKREDMLTWLYDEDRWPSGAAGGLVTKDVRFRSRYLIFTPYPYEDDEISDDVFIGSSAKGMKTGNGRLLACYDIELDDNGLLKSWQMIPENQQAHHEKWYAYLEISRESPWYNNQTYVNTLDKAAMDRFIEITYEAYLNAVGEEFDKNIPAIFTDEPQFPGKSTLKFAKEKTDVTLPWTDDLAETFAEAYAGEDLLGGIPELIWDRADGNPSVIRYHYHDHVCERFVRAFADNCGAWCNAHGLKLTGHVMGEDRLSSQASTLGEAMRCYRSFGLPGVDMLVASFQYNTLKQAQSAVHQFGREGMASELYGVTNWDFDFRGHKLHGDWQAALGVTVRVPHLSWVSMAGEAKRDYPASINYQSPWWMKYSEIENHFARLNTVMTRGKPVVRVGVIHPIESYWLHWGPSDQTALERENLETNFKNLTDWLLFGGIDFDFISESLLPDQCTQLCSPLKVGAMEYDAIIVPSCETLRKSTLERLVAFRDQGGLLVFAGDIAKYVDATPDTRPSELANKSVCVPFSRSSVLNALTDSREIEIRDHQGLLTDNLLYQLREDGNIRYLFISHGRNPYNKDISRYQDLKVRVKGRWNVKLMNTFSGNLEAIAFSLSEKDTEIYRRVYDYDSLLLKLTPAESIEQGMAKVTGEGAKQKPVGNIKHIPTPNTVTYTLSEPNAMLLDQAEYSLDDCPWRPCEEILRLDSICRKELGWPGRNEHSAQPWTQQEEPYTHSLKLRWYIMSEIEYHGAQLAIEDAERLTIIWNGEAVDNTVAGWYVDKAIKTINLPPIRKGENTLEVTIPYGKRTNVEWAYLLGDFGVEIIGRHSRICARRATIAFGNIADQGFPFYGGNISYHIPITTEHGFLRVRSTRYCGVMQETAIDDKPPISVIYPPYMVDFGLVDSGEHTIDLTLYGHRRNSFGPVHLTDLNNKWIGPSAWRSMDDKWCYEYMICDVGVMASPTIEIEDITEE